MTDDLLSRHHAVMPSWMPIYYGDEAIEIVRRYRGKWVLSRASLLARHGRLTDLREYADAGDADAAYELARLLADRGALAELRDRARALLGIVEQVVRVSIRPNGEAAFVL